MLFTDPLLLSSIIMSSWSSSQAKSSVSFQEESEDASSSSSLLREMTTKTITTNKKRRRRTTRTSSFIGTTTPNTTTISSYYLRRRILLQESNNNKNDQDVLLDVNSVSGSEGYSSTSSTSSGGGGGIHVVGGGGSRSTDGPVAVLIVVCILFCFIWTPMLCQRRCRLRRRQQAEDQAAEIIRVSLRNLNLLGIDESATGVGAGGGLSAMFPSTFGGGIGGGGGNGGGSGGGSGSYSYARGLSPEDRSEFIKNILVSRRILHITYHEEHDGEDDEENPSEDTSESPKKENNEDSTFQADKMFMTTHKKMTLLLADVADSSQTSKHVVLEPCAICLNEYAKDEILCSSQNDHCKHVFHEDCITSWLLRQEACPICRTNYLGLEGDDEYYAELYEEEQQQLRRHRDLFLTNVMGSMTSTTPGLPLGSTSGNLGMLGNFGNGSPAASLFGLGIGASGNPRNSSTGGAGRSGLGGNPGGRGTIQEGGATADDGDDASAFLRGMQLYYLLSRLAETRGPNTTIRLEGLELGGGRPLNLEIEGSGHVIPSGGDDRDDVSANHNQTLTAPSSNNDHDETGGDIEIRQAVP